MRTHLDFRHCSIFGFSRMFWEFRLVAKDEEIAYLDPNRNCSFDMSEILKDKEQQAYLNRVEKSR